MRLEHWSSESEISNLQQL